MHWKFLCFLNFKQNYNLKLNSEMYCIYLRTKRLKMWKPIYKLTLDAHTKTRGWQSLHKKTIEDKTLIHVASLHTATTTTTTLRKKKTFVNLDLKVRVSQPQVDKQKILKNLYHIYIYIFFFPLFSFLASKELT